MVMIRNYTKKLVLISAIMMTIMVTTTVNASILNADAQRVCSGGDRVLTTPGQTLCIPGQAKSPSCVPSEEFFPPQTCGIGGLN
jgi:hypothetical protein